MSQANPNPSPDGGDGAYGWGPAQPGYGYPNPAPGYGYPAPGSQGYDPTLAGGPPAQMPSGGGTPLVSIGDITVMNHGIVTPSGTLPLQGAVWNATDMSRTEEKIPTHAIILAVIFFLFCLLGLLFLLMKERKTTGFIQVMVTSGGKHHSTMIPANNPDTFHHVMGQVSYARSLSSM